MATKPLAWQEQGPVNSVDEWVNECWAQGGVGAIISHSSPLQDKKAPRAEPEEDIDVLEPAAQDETLRLNLTLSITEKADATKLENQETRMSLCTRRETHTGMVTELEQVAQLSDAFKAQEEPEESVDPREDCFLPPPPLSLSTEECFEKEGFSRQEKEVAEWISDGEIISDPTEDLTSPDSQNSQEWPQTPVLTEPVDREVDSTSEEMTGDDMTTEENGTQRNFLPDGPHNSEPVTNMSGAAAAAITAHHSPSGRNNSDDEYTVCSPPFADESEEEEEVSVDIMSCQEQRTRLDIRSKAFQHISVSTELEPTSALPALSSAKQQEELLSHSQYKLAPRGANQEAAQQVLGQGSPPLSTVAMEPPSQGGATSQGSGCVVAVRERQSRAGESTEGEKKQTGEEERQKEGGLERIKAVGQQRSRGLLKFSKTVQTQEFKTERFRFVSSQHTRMESDSCDDSQSDSGVSADFSPCSTLEGNATISTGTPAAVPKETPIEREIRRAIEREHSLRRSRGLPNPPTSPEYVEIPLRKTVLCQSLTPMSEKCQGKDRQFAGKKMQHEIQEEAQREQDLVKLGKVPGFYDKGTVRQLNERKQLFEAFQKPNDLTVTVSTRSKAMSWSSGSDNSTLENEEDISSQASTVGGEHVERNSPHSPNTGKGGGSTSLTPRGPDFPEGTGCPVIILENNLSVPAQKLYHAKPEAEPVTAVESERPNISSFRTAEHGGTIGRELEKEEEQEEVAPKENPFFKLRSSTNLAKVEKEIREAQEREKELHKQRISLYGGTECAKGVGVGVGGGGGKAKPASIEAKSPTVSSSSTNGLAVPGSSSRGVIGPPAARQSVGKFGMWPPAQPEEEPINRPEVLHSPRTPRQKTPLVQRWESGLVNGHNEEND